jgi:DNA polymerase elongation subunit (family B)
MECKRRKKQGGPDGDTWGERNDILKWLLVVCFGYTGYRNARFGRIECHEAITSYAREILVHASNMAEALGFRVLHGIVDSLWIQGHGDRSRLCEAISKSVGIPIELEGDYRWIVFLPNKTDGTGALNRYYGVFDDGEVKVRGIELRRRDTPQHFCVVQEAIIDCLAGAGNAGEFVKKIPPVIELLRGFARDILAGNVDPMDMVFTCRVSRELHEYLAFSNQVAALTQLEAHGYHIRAGQKVNYLVTNAGSRDPWERVRVLGFMDGGEEYDREYYLKYLCRCAESMLLPFGYTEEKLLDILK